MMRRKFLKLDQLQLFALQAFSFMTTHSNKKNVFEEALGSLLEGINSTMRLCAVKSKAQVNGLGPRVADTIAKVISRVDPLSQVLEQQQLINVSSIRQYKVTFGNGNVDSKLLCLKSLCSLLGSRQALIRCAS